MVRMPLDPPRLVPPEEIALHHTAESCWVVIEGVVYDLTTFLPDHPGGAVLADACGTDATEPFLTRPMGTGTAHSAVARALLGPRVVGVASDAVVSGWRRQGASRQVGTLPAATITPARRVDLEIGHTIGAEANVWLGVAHGVKDWFDVSFGHATRTGESDFAIRGHLGAGPLHTSLTLGGGYRFQGVPEGDGPGTWAEAHVGLRFGEIGHQPSLELGLVPGIAWLPSSAGAPTRAAAGFGVVVRPLERLSFYAELRAPLTSPLLDPADLDWAGGLRFHTWRHSFTLGAQSSYALATLERLATPDPATFAVHLALTRAFGSG